MGLAEAKPEVKEELVEEVVVVYSRKGRSVVSRRTLLVIVGLGDFK